MEKYSRQLLLKEIGREGQAKLAQATVAIVGIGALGTVAAELLARVGVGKLVLIDRDIIEESNLQRQVLFIEEDVGRSKAIVAKERLQKINSLITLEAHPIHLNNKNIGLLNNTTIILDCTDNLQTRFLLNDYGHKHKIPWIYAAAIKTKGYVFPILPGGPCVRCFLGTESGETCDTVGVLNTITTAIASLQATLAIKMILGEEVKAELYSLDIWKLEFKSLRVKQNPHCPTCQCRYEYLEKEDSIKTIQFCSTGRYQIMGKPQNLAELQQRWERIDEVKRDNGLLQFKNIVLFEDGRALIKASSEQEALSAYSKWIGN